MLAYLAGLGVTTLWIGPVFRQRVVRDDYHGYAIQDFLDVEPRLGTRQTSSTWWPVHALWRAPPQEPSSSGSGPCAPTGDEAVGLRPP